MLKAAGSKRRLHYNESLRLVVICYSVDLVVFDRFGAIILYQTQPNGLNLIPKTSKIVVEPKSGEKKVTP